MLPSGPKNSDNINTDKHKVETMPACQQRNVLFQDRRRDQQNGCNQAMNQAKHRASDAYVISFMGVEISFHRKRVESDS